MKPILKAEMLIKDLNIKTLVSGDKSAWVKFETIRPETIEQLKNLATKDVVTVVVFDEV